MLRCKPPFLSDNSKNNSKNVLHTLKFSLILSEIFYKSKYKLHFHDQKGLEFL